MPAPLFFFRSKPILPGFALSFGFSSLYISFVILIPLSALLVNAADMSWAAYWAAITDARVLQSYRVTLTAALYSTVAATLIGVILAWIITRYEFPGRRLIDALVDLPFALPTSVAGITLSALFIPSGWLGRWFELFGWKIAYAFPGIVVAMIFTGLPFIVRSLQPVMEEIEAEQEEAAATLGARKWQIFCKVIFPTLVPALITGSSQAFIRSLGEFGAVIMIAGNIPFQTEVTSLMIFVRLQEFNYSAAAAIASVVLVASLLLLFLLQLVQVKIFQRHAR
ncbi:sulfate ABC transporter permease subunit CysT [Herbaspirillum sp. RTI4]|uniref:sulfate ABC transporter permease subunit CysT n=1 Tax=Herbaspirillum sp. RTI4 TaxID=3048640 RepID=UPI002AB512FB|nr:sulfate ABC transporter permease subunit CysT [Herbaspirillum sp. RTI4]MDY7577456.1 sulfate ABC transporter permease subunit CysT [Herbaspirillum sp. RTI4]MEA9981732.1 sulfate ABC transporter permease subunit CysT [Herbaspirillum sp. RTI4]